MNFIATSNYTNIAYIRRTYPDMVLVNVASYMPQGVEELVDRNMCYLQPPTETRHKYQNKQIDFNQFSKEYLDAVKSRDNMRNGIAEIVTMIRNGKKVCLLCWEKKAEECHRSIVAKIVSAQGILEGCEIIHLNCNETEREKLILQGIDVSNSEVLQMIDMFAFTRLLQRCKDTLAVDIEECGTENCVEEAEQLMEEKRRIEEVLQEVSGATIESVSLASLIECVDKQYFNEGFIEECKNTLKNNIIKREKGIERDKEILKELE